MSHGSTEPMRYIQIEDCEIINGNGVGVTLGVQGCELHCKGCHNPETGDLNGGEILTGKEESQIYQILKAPTISRFSVSGGEPLREENLYQLNYILCTIKSKGPDKKVGIGTGYTGEQLQERQKQDSKIFVTLKYTDFLIAGPFIEKEKDLTLLWRGSRNQEIIDVQKTIKEGRKAFYV